MACHRVLGLALMSGILLTTGNWAVAETPSPQPQSELKPMLKIHWERGPSLPQGLQTNEGGFIGDWLVQGGGFCNGAGDEKLKPGKYPRGFLKKFWAINLGDAKGGWMSLPDLPGVPRQALFGTVVNDALYVWGGLSYDKPYTYADGSRLRQMDGKWAWDRLPDLPTPLAFAGKAAVGSRIYIVGGSDYSGEGDGAVFTNRDHAGGNVGQGLKHYVIDTDHLDKGWKELAPLPGAPRCQQAMAAIDGKVYVIGGFNFDTTGNRAVVDNWRYDPVTNAWERLRDMATSASDFYGGEIVYKNRYLLLVGGSAKYNVLLPDGGEKPAYGTPSYAKGHEGSFYTNAVYVYDTKSNLFGTADAQPLNNAWPMTLVKGDWAYILGGEADADVFDGEWYGHHPDLFLLGRLSVVGDE